MTVASTQWDTAWHRRAELTRILEMLARLLEQQRRRGRSSAGDAVRGLVIEDGEAEGLIAELGADLTGADPGPGFSDGMAASSKRRQVAEHAANGVAQGAYLPLRHAERAFELTPVEYDAFLLALSVELDSRFGRLIAYINDHVARTRPTLGLALSLAGLEHTPLPDAIGAINRPVFRDGLIELEGDGPLPGLALKLPRAILERVAAPDLASTDSTVVVHPPERDLLDRLALDGELRRVLAAWAERQRRGERTSDLIFAGADGSGRTTAARAAASEAGLPLVVVDITADLLTDRLRIARRESRWHGAAVLLRISDQSASTPMDWSSVWSELARVRLPVFAAGPPALMRQAAASSRDPRVLVFIEPPDAGVRQRLWRSALPRDCEVEPSELAELAAKFRFTPRAIALAVRHALAEMALAPAGDRRLSREALERACRDVTAAEVGSLAQRLALPYRLDDLVVPPELAAELKLALAWVREEHKVLDEWGFRRRLVIGRGLTALFSGPPGTGKTMAAQVLARELGLDLYRVDLSRIMSKYIGETEKNLAQLFDQAQSSVLFFDEADALFGKRSAVKEAHDRYANVEIGYLLQRMEEHDGVTVLATNRMGDMDDAFIRRFHVIAQFPMPTEPDRERIWTGMFPGEAALAADVDFTGLAHDYELSGGEIKNAALAAAYLAADSGEPIRMTHLTRAIRREIVKSGRVADRE